MRALHNHKYILVQYKCISLDIVAVGYMLNNYTYLTYSHTFKTLSASIKLNCSLNKSFYNINQLSSINGCSKYCTLISRLTKLLK